MASTTLLVLLIPWISLAQSSPAPQQGEPVPDYENETLKVPRPVDAPVSYRFCNAGFSVRKAGTNSLSAVSKVHFKEVLTNAGGWDTANSEFRPPCAGTYFFTFHALSDKDTDFTMALMKNEQYQVTAYGGKTEYKTGSNSALLFLNPGDTISLKLQQGAIYEHPYNEAYTTFTGFLVDKF